jgi:hypothetical protein
MSKNIFPSNGTYLFLMQGGACGTWKLGGMFPLRVHGVKLQMIYIRNCLASDANCRGKRIITRKREPTIGSIFQEG